MSFGRLRAIALDGSQPVGRRLIALGSAVQRYSWLTQTSYQSVREALTSRYGLGRRPPPDAAIRAAFGELDDARRAFLEMLAGFRALRRSEKRTGGRRPADAAVRALYRSARLGTPRQSGPLTSGA
ncbi:MAG: hypothetical protein HYV09_15615 [Deltaproteobacteria bacterium]|nr:hypothetical protein [Deltaproteobacteria bacterium]